MSPFVSGLRDYDVRILALLQPVLLILIFMDVTLVGSSLKFRDIPPTFYLSR
jgi:hypothetical protein